MLTRLALRQEGYAHLNSVHSHGFHAQQAVFPIVWVNTKVMDAARTHLE